MSEELDLCQDNRVSVTPGEELDLRQGDRISVISGGGIDLGHGVFIRIAPSGFLIWVRDAGNHLTITSLKGIDIEKITS
ncbi:hypothetical protein AR454_00985 [Bacillus mycoides]|nr:hypothetical protein [Bacillus mycoides]